MIIKGRRRGGAKNLSDHLRRTDENEQVKFHDLEGFAFDKLTGPKLEIALKQMEAIGYAKGDKRNLYHAILAPAYGETLNAKQRDFMLNYYLEHMGFKGHQYALVEHWKHGKQHFHLVVNIINPETGKTHELKWTKRNEWRISRGLEEILGLSTPTPKGKAQPTWAMQRGKRTGIDPRKMRKEVTAIFHASKTAKQFIAALDKAGYGVAKGNRGQLVLVDSKGDTHGLMRMIEGQKVADLRRKFPGIDRLPYPPHANMVRARQQNPGQETPGKPVDAKFVKGAINAAIKNSKTGVEFVAQMNRQQYSFGRTIKGFAIIDRNGGRHDLNTLLGKDGVKDLYRKFPDLAAIKPSPVMDLVRRMRSGKPSRVTRHPLKPARLRFNAAARSFSQAPHMSGSVKPVMFGSTTGLMMKLASITNPNATKEEAKQKAQQDRFPLIVRGLKSIQRSGGKIAGLYPRFTKVFIRRGLHRLSASGGDNGSGSTSGNPSPITELFHWAAWMAKHRREQEQKQQPMPMRPAGHGAMSEAQRIDLAAAIDGKITWAEYFRKWGGGQPSP